MSAVKAIPDGFHSITPSIVCKNAAKAIDYYKEVFHAQEKVRMAGPGGLIMHAELLIGDSHLMLNDEIPGFATAPPADAPNASNLFLYTDNVDAVFNRAVQAGAKVEMPLQNQFWGDRYGKIRDPIGHRWGLAQHVEDVAPEDMKKRSEAFAAQTSKGLGPDRIDLESERPGARALWAFPFLPKQRMHKPAVTVRLSYRGIVPLSPLLCLS